MGSVKTERLQKLYHEIRAVIDFDQPRLTATQHDDQVVVEGTFILTPRTDEFRNSGPIAEYNVKISFPAVYPRKEPIVYETGNAFPRNLDHHVNSNGSCCIVVWESWRVSSDDNSVQAYFDGPLTNYFLGQVRKKETGKWPFGEWAHGYEGLLYSYSEVLGCPRKERKILYMLRLLSKEWPKGHWNCPCDSGKIVRKCCQNELRKLSLKVPPHMAKGMTRRLNKERKKARRKPPDHS